MSPPLFDSTRLASHAIPKTSWTDGQSVDVQVKQLRDAGAEKIWGVPKWPSDTASRSLGLSRKGLNLIRSWSKGWFRGPAVAKRLWAGAA